MKTSELTGLALNWAVAQCESKIETGAYGSPEVCSSQLHLHYCDTILSFPYNPSTDWSQGGQIIEREKIGTTRVDNNPDIWAAHITDPLRTSSNVYSRLGRTPLIAAMRCLVASKMGEEVEIPEELLK